MSLVEEFEFKSDPKTLDPKAFVELSRPGEGHANEAGDLAFVTVSKFSISERRCVYILLNMLSLALK